MHIFHILNIDTAIEIKLIINEFNKIQNSFRIVEYKKKLELKDEILIQNIFFDTLQKELNNEIQNIIAITKKPLDKNFFSDVDQNYRMAIISLDQSELYTPTIKVEDYIRSEILLSLLSMLTKIEIGHYDTRGCLFDFCGDKKDIIVKLHSGSICADCKARLMYYGVTEEELVSAQKLLWEISKDFISVRGSKGCPIGHKVCKEFHEIRRLFSEKNIFLAISFGKEYEDMIDHLKTKFDSDGFTLKVVNQAINNKNILCKICKTIQTCKYGIGEFSGFRHNVSYEFGLMQAFGLESIGIIKKDRLSDFEQQISDMKGIEIIPYDSISGDLFTKLQNFLV